MATNLRQKMLSGMFWSGLGQVWSVVINFVISIVLARLLVPEDFGIVAIINVFIAFFSVFIDTGFGSALVQKKELDPEDCSSVFFINLAMAFLLYAGIFFASPWIADFYRKPILCPCIRVSALTMIISTFSGVQNTMIYRELRMSVFFRISVISQGISGCVGIVMALRSFGVWALVTQAVLKSVISTGLLWFWGTWRPIWVISFSRLKGLFQFGGKIFCSRLFDAIYDNLYPILFGKLFDFSTLAYYNRGNNLPHLGIGLLNNAVIPILFPAFSSIQNDRAQIAQILKRVQSGMFFLVIPMMTFLFITAEPVIVLLFKEKWLPAVPYMRIFCFSYALYLFCTSNQKVLEACGRSDVLLILVILTKTQLALSCLVTFRFGPLAMAYGVAVLSVLEIIETAWMNHKLIGFGIVKQVLNILPIVIISLLCAVPCLFILKVFHGVLAQIFVSGLCYVTLYFGVTYATGQMPTGLIQGILAKFSSAK